jgi:BirA family biotin operon repressor/biotin-[acetyl-CoA-carboxylase] ligase
MTKDKVLAILKRSGSCVSGEEMSRALGVSRAAVNAAVMALRSDGYEIGSGTNRGYELKNAPDRLNMGELMALLPEERLKTVVCLDSVDSTNDRLRAMAMDGAPDGQIVLANCQTRGKGRLGREFRSPADKGVYMSLLLRPESAPADMAPVTAWTAEAMCGAVERACGARPGIKWINDLVMDKKKICGILTEMSVESESGRVQFVIIGVGVNANETPEDFPPEIRNVAGSIMEAAGGPVSRAKLAAEMINGFDALRAGWPGARESVLAGYRRDCLTPGNEVVLISAGREERAFAEGVDDSFGLAVRLRNGERRVINSGEVSVRGLCGYV